ncbi:MAG: DUF4202 domain-containing protein [Polyangiaceae bacterium]|nr:DUF4202 domain-containing protein [Polyangiaceae bacterium]
MSSFETAIRELDRLNAEDPTTVLVEGQRRPRQLVHAEWLSGWVERLDPEASEALRLAARAQHLMRFRIPRDDFPEGRTGYLEWRKAAARFHASEAEQVLARAGYDKRVMAEVRRIILKQGIKQYPDVQTMEDALCLSFLERELAVFAAKHDEDKVVHILLSTWKKMSERGQEHALALKASLPPALGALLDRALASEG